MSANYKGRTNDTQVAIRESDSADAKVLMRLANGSEIEVSKTVVSYSDGVAWRQVAYGYQKLGYMMDQFITITDKTAKYYMIETLENFGNQTYVRGDSDLRADSGDIHNIQTSLNRLASNFFSDIPGRPLMTVDVDGIFGSATETAVKNAQAFMGCDIDGKVGPHTKARLYYCAYGCGGWPLAENAE